MCSERDALGIQLARNKARGFGISDGMKRAANLVMEDAKVVFERGDDDGYADRLRTIATNLRGAADTEAKATRALTLKDED